MSNTIGFDESFYLSQNPDVAAAVSRGIFTSGAQHYQLNGRFEARNPNAFFNTSFYLGQYPDVAKAGINPLTHFLNNGAAEGRFANATEKAAIDLNNNGGADDFNEAAYRAQYSDVDAAIKAGTFKSGYQHFVQFGQFEARVATLSNGTTITGPFSNTGVNPNTGTTFTLTTGVDSFTGGALNDTFNATGKTLTALDKIDGGAGVDTLIVQDADASFAGGLPSSVSIANVEKVTVNSSGSLGQVNSPGTSPTVAQREIDSFAFTVNNTTSSATLDVTYGGVTVTTAALDGSPTPTEISTLVANAINAIAGTTVANVVGGNVVVTSPTAGTPLPSITIVASAPTDISTAKTDVQDNQTASAGTAATTAAVFDLSTATGLTDFNGNASGVVNLKVADTANVTIANAAAAASVSVAGGKVVNVTNGAGAVTIDGGNGLTSATVTGGTTVAIDDQVAGVSSKTLTSVTINKIGGTATLVGDAITTLTLGGANAAPAAVNITNATANHTLTVNAAGAGYNSATVPAAQPVTVTDTNAATIALNTSAKSAIALGNMTGLTKVTAAGAGDLALNLNGSINTGVTSFDGSTATGGLTLTNLSAATVSVKTGSGADSLTALQTAKATIDVGAGNDVVTLGSALAAGSTINLGAGDDKLLSLSGSVANSTTTDITRIDGGDGIDTIAASLVNAGNQAQFTNFEVLGLDRGASTTFDVNILAASTIQSLELLASGGEYQNVKLSQSLAVNSNITGTTTLTFANVTGASDAYTINLGGTAATGATAAVPTPIGAGTISLAGVETINLNSSGTGFVSHSITLADAAAQTVTITGDKALTLAFATDFGNTTGKGVTAINGGSATGALNIDVANVTAASTGLTVTGGSAADKMTSNGNAVTFTGNGGLDNYDVHLNVLGAGPTDAAKVAKIVTVTDFVKGETIDFSTTANSGSSVAVTKVALGTGVATLAQAIDAAANAGATSGSAPELNYFNFSGDTYVVYDTGTQAGTGGVGAGDIVVKLSGIVDLTGATFNSAGGLLTY